MAGHLVKPVTPFFTYPVAYELTIERRNPHRFDEAFLVTDAGIFIVDDRGRRLVAVIGRNF